LPMRLAAPVTRATLSAFWLAGWLGIRPRIAGKSAGVHPGCRGRRNQGAGENVAAPPLSCGNIVRGAGGEARKLGWGPAAIPRSEADHSVAAPAAGGDGVDLPDLRRFQACAVARLRRLARLEQAVRDRHDDRHRINLTPSWSSRYAHEFGDHWRDRAFHGWTYRASANIHALGGQGIRFTPSWAVAWYWIPIANLWMPYQVMSEIWRLSRNPVEPQSDATSRLLAWWWFCWLAFLIGGSFQLRWSTPMHGLEEVISAEPLSIASSVFGIITAGLALALIKRICALQVLAADRSLSAVFA
jgi:hypothetical protein